MQNVSELQYRCRRCLQVERGEIAQSEDGLGVVIGLFSSQPNYMEFQCDGLKAAAFKVHRCEDGAHGVLDFIGFKE